jgi:hypothetical protein
MSLARLDDPLALLSRREGKQRLMVNPRLYRSYPTRAVACSTERLDWFRGSAFECLVGLTKFD